MTAKPVKLSRFMIVAYASIAPKGIIGTRDDEPYMMTDEGSIPTQRTNLTQTLLLMPFDISWHSAAMRKSMDITL